MPKRIVLLVTLIFCLVSLNAQGENNTTLGVETGLVGLFDSETFGSFLHVEPKHRFSKNAVIGLRIGITINTQVIENRDIFQFEIGESGDNGVISFVPTFEYHLQKNKLHPYVGFGVGYYLAGTYLDVSRAIIVNPSEDVFEVGIKNQVGLLVRGGIKPGKLRLGIEYNFIPKADIEVPSGESIGTFDKSYLGLSVGFIIGGGESTKAQRTAL
jgi:hypothetical protein